MTLSEGIQHDGFPFHVPDCSRNELPKFLKEQRFNVGAEIGVYVGEFTERFLKEDLKMYAIDPWCAYSGSGRTFQVQQTQDTVFKQAYDRLLPFGNCTIVKKTAMDALVDFPDGSLDFVYIDGNHDFSHVAEDLYEWEKKVRRGGIVSGHDYYHTPSFARNVICHVGPIVDAYVEIFDIKNFYTFGGNPVDRHDYDRYLSWMWFKP